MTISHTGHNCLHGAAGVGAAGAGGWGTHHLHPGGGGGIGAGGRPKLGESFISGDPLHLIFPNPASLPASGSHLFSLQAISLPGGITMSLVALVAISCLVVILASTLVKTLVVRCSS